MNVLAIDVGTSSVKAAIIDASTLEPVTAIARVTYPLDQPDADTATIPTERLWHAITYAIRTAAAGNGKIDGMGMSVLTPGLILLDENDAPLIPIVTHLDRRSRPEASRAWNDLGDRYLQSAGNRPLPGGISVTSFRHVTNHQPDLTSAIRRYVHVNGWLGLRLTGIAAFDRANASFTGLLDSTGSREWSPEWCRYFGVAMAWLPDVCSGDATLGPLQSAVAHELGLPGGIPVKLGTADTSCAMLSAGARVGDLLHLVGTTQVLAALVDTPRPATVRLTRLFGVGDRYLHVTHNPVGGVALDWLHQLCFRDQTADQFFEESVRDAATRATDVVLNPPFLGGDRLEIETRRAALTQLTLNVDRMDVLAAVLNALREHHQEAVKNLGVPGPFRRVFLSGGASHAIRGVIPDYQRQPIVQLEEASLRGVACLFNS